MLVEVQIYMNCEIGKGKKKTASSAIHWQCWYYYGITTLEFLGLREVACRAPYVSLASSFLEIKWVRENYLCILQSQILYF